MASTGWRSTDRSRRVPRRRDQAPVGEDRARKPHARSQLFCREAVSLACREGDHAVQQFGRQLRLLVCFGAQCRIGLQVTGKTPDLGNAHDGAFQKGTTRKSLGGRRARSRVMGKCWPPNNHAKHLPSATLRTGITSPGDAGEPGAADLPAGGRRLPQCARARTAQSEVGKPPATSLVRTKPGNGIVELIGAARRRNTVELGVGEFPSGFLGRRPDVIL